MICSCSRCGGTGSVECLDCDGKGVDRVPIEAWVPDKKHEHYEALLALHEDATRAMRQCEQLKALLPARAESYCRQLDATLAEINRQADEVGKAAAR